MRVAEEEVWAREPDTDLMARAASAVADAIRANQPDLVLVVAGPGNNGGDGLFAAAELAEQLPVYCWLPTGTGHTRGLAVAGEHGVRQLDAQQARELLERRPLVLDAFTGLGARPGLPQAVAELADECVRLSLTVIAVDLPSGLVADSARAYPSFRATKTITFAAAKLCHLARPAAQKCGLVDVADIGVLADKARIWAVTEEDLASWFPWPTADSDKYSRGVVAFDTGSERFPGAALLGLAGALHTGTGLVRYLGEVNRELIHGNLPSVVVGQGRAQSIVIGSGWGEPDQARMARAAALGIPVVADAEALYCLPDQELTGWLLTPHAGELARLLGLPRTTVEEDPVTSVLLAAHRTGATVLLKGSNQYVAKPDGKIIFALAGTSWSATAGSGDVLAGSCGALLAAGLPAWQAGGLAASLQALTAKNHPGPYPPERIASWLPETVAALAG